MATNRGLAGWRRRENAKAAAERREQRERVRVTPEAKDQLAYWRGHQPEWLHFVYFIVEYSGGNNAVKIGTAADPLTRAVTLQIGNPRPLQLAQVLYGTPASEETFHDLWKGSRVRGEWFAPADEILEWATWAAAVQREQFEQGERHIRIRQSYGKHPREWREQREAA